MKFIDIILNKTGLSTNRRKVVKNVYWAVLGKVVGIASQLLVGIMVARYLGPDQFGLMSYVISYVMLFSVLATFGLDSVEIRELSKNDANRNAIMGTAFALRISFAVLTIFLILLTLWKFEPDRYTFAMVMVYSLTLVCGSFSVIRNYFTSIILNEYVVKTEITRTIIGALIKVVLLLFHCSLTWFIVASTFDFVLVGGGYLYSYRAKAGSVRDWYFDRIVAAMLVRASFPLLLSGTAIVIYQQINAIMIRNMLDNTSVGQFSVGARITELAVFVPIVIAQTVTPLLVKAYQEDPNHYRKKCQHFMDIMVWSSIAISLFLSLLAIPVIRFLYGDKYLNAIPVLQIMAWRTVPMALFSASGQMIVIENIQRYAVVRNLVGCIVSVCLNYLLIPIWGIVGSAVAIVLTMSFAGYFSHMLIRPYHYLVPMQTSALFFGWRRLFEKNSSA